MTKNKLAGLGLQISPRPQITLQDATCSEGRNGGRQIEAELELLIKGTQALEHLRIGCNDGQTGCLIQLWPLGIEVTLFVQALETMAAEDITLQCNTLP